MRFRSTPHTGTFSLCAIILREGCHDYMVWRDGANPGSTVPWCQSLLFGYVRLSFLCSHVLQGMEAFVESVDQQAMADLHGLSYNRPQFGLQWKNLLVLPKKWFVVVNVNGTLRGNSDTYMSQSSVRTDMAVQKNMKNWWINAKCIEYVQCQREGLF